MANQDRTIGEPLVPVSAVISAAGYLAREWDDHGYSIGGGVFAATYESDGREIPVYVFECAHWDGSRFFIATDKWGNVGNGDTSPDACTSMRGKMDAAAERRAREDAERYALDSL